MGKYSKTITALVTGVLGWFAVVIAASPNHFVVSNTQWLSLGMILATALGVFGMPNTAYSPPGPPPMIDGPGQAAPK